MWVLTNVLVMSWLLDFPNSEIIRLHDIQVISSDTYNQTSEFWV